MRNIKIWWHNRTKKDRVMLLVLVSLCIGLTIYNYTKDKEIEIPLSEAIILSQSEIFNEMVVSSDGKLTTLDLTISDGVNRPSVDIDGKSVALLGSQKVKVGIGVLNIKELAEMGFVLPSTYSTDYANSKSWWESLLPLLILFGCGALLYYLYVNGYLGVNKKFKKSKNDISLKDIGGIAEIKEGISDVISFLKDRSYYDKIGATIPKGILLVGAPGTGKTMLAKAIATEADVPFYYTTGSEFHNMWVGLAAMRVKGLFKQASRSTSIVFIDEFDSIAHKRSMATGDASREWNHTLNQLLAEMDGFKKNTTILVVAATNRVDVLDPAVMRPGRFDRKITVPLPNYKERREILELHCIGKLFSKDVKLDEVARQTVGFSGADLALLINEAAIISAKGHHEQIDTNSLQKAIDKVLVGDERRSFSITEDERKTIAYHEAGHAIVASYIPEGDKVERVTILPHGNSGGFTRVGQESESIIITKSKAMRIITILLGGRVADGINGDITSGAQDDIKKANELARQMVEQFGMGEKFGLKYSVVNQIGATEMCDDTRAIIEEDIEGILNNCYSEASMIINEHLDSLDKITTALLKYETLTGNEIQNIIKEA